MGEPPEVFDATPARASKNALEIVPDGCSGQAYPEASAGGPRYDLWLKTPGSL